MRDHARISPQFWIGQTGRAIRQAGDDALIVAFYLLTCPSANMIGLYYLPLPVLAHETGRTIQGARKALRSLCEVDFARYDETSEYVWVVKMAKFQIGDRLKAGDKRHGAIVKLLEEAHYSTFTHPFHALYGEAYGLPEPRPSEGAQKDLRCKEQEQEQESTTTSVHRSGATEDFETFWKSYPAHRRKEKADALKAWKQASTGNGFLETVLAALSQQSKSHDWTKEGGSYVPYPARWLRRTRWLDAVEEGTVPDGFER